MQICFPVKNDAGLKSKLFDHLGSTPFFLIVDTETDNYIKIVNSGKDHISGTCLPAKHLQGYAIDAIVAKGIGAGALIGLS